TELTSESSRSAETVRLKRHEDAPSQTARCGQYRGNLRRMMTIVVDHQNAVRLAADFKPAFGAAEVRKPVCDLLERDPELEPDRGAGESIRQVVSSRHLQRQRPKRRRPRFAGRTATSNRCAHAEWTDHDLGRAQMRCR